MLVLSSTTTLRPLLPSPRQSEGSANCVGRVKDEQVALRAGGESSDLVRTGPGRDETMTSRRHRLQHTELRMIPVGSWARQPTQHVEDGIEAEEPRVMGEGTSSGIARIFTGYMSNLISKTKRLLLNLQAWCHSPQPCGTRLDAPCRSSRAACSVASGLANWRTGGNRTHACASNI